MGSRDRKQVSEMIYCFFRLGHTLKNISPEQKIPLGLFLCNHQKDQVLEQLQPEWNALVEISREEKLEWVRKRFPEFSELDIFPWKEQLSAGIDHRSFCLSFLEKPRIFIRVRPEMEDSLLEKLEKHSAPFRNADPAGVLGFKAYSFPGGTKLEEVFEINRDAVIQDLSSQRTAEFIKINGKKEFEAWDCCAGSGGKSILVADLFPGCKITVSDIRESILKNCQQRLKEAGIKPVRSFKADLTSLQEIPRQFFNFIVADLPCTGSGTWSRTPEALYFFKPESISYYSQRQEKIISNVLNRLRPGGILVYLTCSVFAEENEKISNLLTESGNVQLEKERLIDGCDMAADSMYAARFVRIR